MYMADSTMHETNNKHQGRQNTMRTLTEDKNSSFTTQTIANTLTDGSKVFDVYVTLKTGEKLAFNCMTQNHALALALRINECVNIDRLN
jgi:hypothetical protein